MNYAKPPKSRKPEQTQNHLRQHNSGGRGVFYYFSLFVSVFMLIVLVASFRIPNIGGQGSESFIGNIHLTREISGGGNQSLELAELSRGDRASAKQISARTRKFSATKSNVDDDTNELISYAYDQCGKDFVLTIEGENGLWKWDRRSIVKGAGGYYAYGICQFYDKYHHDFIFNTDGSFTEEFKDSYKQIDRCCGVYKNAESRGILNTTFYAYPHRYKNAKLYTFN